MVYGAMVLMGISLAFLLANRMYRPVRKIISIFTDYSDLRGVDEFSFIQKTASEIRETNMTLRETINNHKLSLKSKFLRDLLFGLLTKEQVQQGMTKYGLEWLRLEFTVVLFDFPDEKGWENEYSLEAILQIKSQTMEVIREHIKELALCESVEMDHSRYAILIPEIRLDHIKRMMVAAVAGVEASFAIPIAAAVGPPVLHAHQLNESYRLACRLLEQRFALYKQSVLTYDDLARLQNLNYYYPLEREREMIVSILQGNAEQTEELLDHVLEENLGARRLHENALPFFLYAFLSTINRVLQQMNKTESDIFPEGQPVRESLLSGRSEEQIRQRLHSLVGRLIEAARQKNQEMDRSVVHHMIDYMHAHYHEDIALADLAKHFNLSSNYISYLIKEHIGDNFKDYLNEYRVRQAKRIISENPDIKVNDLAGMVGCNNVNTFIRIFKKYEGISPGQYMKQQN
ncbi:HTH-type transcriptional regulator YesS [compost metagenome]